MLAAVFSALLVVAAAKRPTWKDLEGYNFDHFIADFGLKLEKGSTEYHMRRSIFMTELTRVKEHNAKNLSWKEGVNKYSAMTASEKTGFFGHSTGVDNAYKPRHAVAYSGESAPVERLPRSVDWRKSGIVNAVKDQGHCGSCWAFAATSVIESHVAKATGLLFDLSVEQMAMCSPNPDACGGTGGCNGATAELGMDYVANSKGMYEEYQYSYTSYYGQDAACYTPFTAPVAGIEGFVQLPANNYTALMNAVAKEGPVAISVDASTWHAYESGIYNGCNQVNPDIDHGVVLVGYGEENGQKYWTVRNSWSPAWGEAGYIRVARSDDEGNLCGIDIDPSDGLACGGDTTPVKVCGTCGLVFDAAYPTGAKLV